MTTPSPAGQGRVYLVGAGPGHPGLITLRGVQCLKRADLVLHDYLVNPLILAHAQDQAELICLGRHGRGHGRLWSQQEVNARMIEEAQAGRQVVRLKGGDPAVFARGTEEAEALTAAGVAFEIVPGVTAALAAGSYAGIPITHRRHASAVALVTGQEGDAKGDSNLDFAALARFPGTLVFYMGVTTAPHWTAALIQHGRDPKQPAAVIRRCSLPDQEIVRCTLEEVAAEIESRKLRPPVIVVLGEVVNLADQLSWFTRQPLFGKSVLVTRPEHQAEPLRAELAELGADVFLQPAIEIAEPQDWTAVDAAVARLEQFDWIVFSSSNGVQSFLDRVCSGGDLRQLAQAKLAVIGPGTADELSRYHLRADLLPEEYRAEALAEELAAVAQGKRLLLVRASRGREVLAEQLTAAGGEVTQVVCYESRDVAAPNEDVAAALSAGRIDWITVTSSAIARSLAALFGDDLRHAKLASISPITSATLKELGHLVTAEATEYTMPGVVQAILRAEAP